MEVFCSGSVSGEEAEVCGALLAGPGCAPGLAANRAPPAKERWDLLWNGARALCRESICAAFLRSTQCWMPTGRTAPCIWGHPL